MMEVYFFSHFLVFWEASAYFFPSKCQYLRLFFLPQECYLEILHIWICSVFLHVQGVWQPGNCSPIHPFLTPSHFSGFLSSVFRAVLDMQCSDTPFPAALNYSHFFSPYKFVFKIIFDTQHCCSVCQTLKLLLLWFWGRTVDCLVGCRHLRVRSCDRGYSKQMLYIQLFSWFIPTFLGRFKQEIICISYLTGVHSCDIDTMKCFRFQFYSHSD